MAIDREATLKNAEKFLRVGRVDAAITEYARVVDEQPRDWTTANTLGDLYVRAKQPERAVALYLRIADHLRTEGFYPKAAALYKKILKITPDDEVVQLHLADMSARQGLLADAKAYFGAVAARRRQRGDEAGADDIAIRIAGIDPGDLAARLAGARAVERGGDLPGAARHYRELYDEFKDNEREDDAAAALHDCLRCDPSMFEGVADEWIARGEFAEAAAILQEVAARAPGQIGILLRLVEVCVDGGLDSTMYEAQAQLADAYLAADRAEEARVIAEDLVTREPEEISHIERLRTALTMLDVEDVEGAIAARMTAVASEPVELFDDFSRPAVHYPTATAPAPVGAALPDTAPPEQPPAEVDLTTLLSDLEGQSVPPQPDAPQRPAPDLEDVFAAMRFEAAAGVETDDSAEHLALARSYIDMGQADEAVGPLQIASRSPQYRFTAASALGQIFRDQSELPRAIEWFERAIEAPAPSADEGRAVLYDLGDVLEAMGETSRALAVFLELAADAPDFRDVGRRVTNLSSAETEG